MNEHELAQLQRDFDRVAVQLRKLAFEVLEQEVSKYPLFVASKQPVGIGIPAIRREDYRLQWAFNVSIAEELVRKSVIPKERFELFKAAYEQPTHVAMILLVGGKDASFVKIPYPVSTDAGHENL